MADKNVEYKEMAKQAKAKLAEQERADKEWNRTKKKWERERKLREIEMERKLRFGDPVPDFCEKCSEPLVEYKTTKYERYDSVTGAYKGTTTVIKACPKQASRWSRFWLKNLGHSVFHVWSRDENPEYKSVSNGYSL